MATNGISVIVPTYQARPYLPALIQQLRQQSLPPEEILVLDSSSSDGTALLAQQLGCRVHTIPKADFNHGGTRNLGARLVSGNILVFMTQDALPVDDRFVEEITRPIREGSAVAVHARHVPYPSATPPEAFARGFNYPDRSHTRNLKDIPKFGIKAFFFSNVSSAVRRDLFWAAGGFPERVILNEDMLLCARLLRQGHTVAYQSEARVYHSHNYSLLQQFRRYFDIGVAMSQASEDLGGARAGGEGVRFAVRQIRHLATHGAWTWIPRSAIESCLKYTAYQLGRRERLLPRPAKRLLSMHSFFWDR